MSEKMEHPQSISRPERLELEMSCSSFSTGALSPEARFKVYNDFATTTIERGMPLYNEGKLVASMNGRFKMKPLTARKKEHPALFVASSSTLHLPPDPSPSKRARHRGHARPPVPRPPQAAQIANADRGKYTDMDTEVGRRQQILAAHRAQSTADGVYGDGTRVAPLSATTVLFSAASPLTLSIQDVLYSTTQRPQGPPEHVVKKRMGSAEQEGRADGEGERSVMPVLPSRNAFSPSPPSSPRLPCTARLVSHFDVRVLSTRQTAADISRIPGRIPSLLEAETGREIKHGKTKRREVADVVASVTRAPERRRPRRRVTSGAFSHCTSA
ncbi:hypothetical protein DFH09DRAFT_1291719 [Mycena vulgaris]|nr:hypothetical protein DFH09DRAFT_1291719 [Mycena vulgaris]